MFSFLSLFKSLFQKKQLSRQEKLSQRFVDVACHSGFQVFRASRFRYYVDFNELHQIEQDRIFNELACTALCLIFFIFDDYLAIIKSTDNNPEKKEFIHNLRASVRVKFIDWLAELRIPRKFVQIWDKLINLRMDEYKKDIPEIEAAFKELKEKFPTLGNKLTHRRTQIMSVGCLHHVCRGKVEDKDPLFIYLLHWIRKLDIKLTGLLNKCL